MKSKRKSKKVAGSIMRLFAVAAIFAMCFMIVIAAGWPCDNDPLSGSPYIYDVRGNKVVGATPASQYLNNKQQESQ